MGPLRSVLWIGRAGALPTRAIARTPSIDVVWEPDLTKAIALGPARFDGVVLDADDPDRALRQVAEILSVAPGACLIARLPGDAAGRLSELHAAGVRRALLRDTEPDSTSAVLETLSEALGPTQPALAGREDPPHPALAALSGDSAPMRRLRRSVQRAARSRVTVLISGETGTGKERVARAIHALGPRGQGPFVAVNCASLPDTLLESELLGHARGAFTGADRERRGLIEEAAAGTLFLDEIGDASPSFQAKLLRVLQERRIRPLGSSRERRVDVRVVAATHRNLPGAVAEGCFREDLFYRLAVFPIETPPLRARGTDLRQLAHELLETSALEDGKAGCALSKGALERLEAHAWPGNVRELENEIQRAVALAEPGALITENDLSDRLVGYAAPAERAFSSRAPGETLRDTLDRVETWVLRRSLDVHGGRRAETARALGITREGLYKKLKRLGIE